MSKQLAHSLLILIAAISFISSSTIIGNAAITLKIARRGHTSSTLADGRVVIIGGENQSGAVREVEIIDPRTQTVTMSAPLKIARFRHTATLLNDGRVLVTGGWNGKDIFDSTEIFDPVTKSFSPGPKLDKPRAAHNAIALADGHVLITGGCDDASAEVFDTKTQTFTLLNNRMNTARSFHATIVLHDGNVMLVGGVDEDGQRLDSAELFNPTTLSFSNTLGNTNIRRLLPSLRLLPDGKVQLSGGDYDGTMELYDPARRVFSAPAHLRPTSDVFPSGMERLSTRAAFIGVRAKSKTPQQKSRARMLAHAMDQQLLKTNSLLLDRVDYSESETSNLDQTIVSGGIDSKGRYLRSIFLLNSSPASVTTNKTEYSQGERPVIYGSGWQPGETISIVRQEARSSHGRTYLNAVADVQGNFINTQIGNKDFHEGVTYTMTVMGRASGRVAQTVYKDAEPADPKRQQNPDSPDFNVPLLPRDVSYELEDGILILQQISNGQKRVKPPARPTAEDEDVTTFSFNFDPIANQSCLGLGFACPSLCPCPAGIDIQIMPGSHISIGAQALSGGTIDLEEPAVIGFVGVKESITGHLGIRATVTPTAFFPDAPRVIPMTLTDTKFKFSKGIFSGTMNMSVAFQLEFQVEPPGTTVEASVDFGETTEVKIDVDTRRAADKVLKFDPSSSSNFNASLTKIETNGGCLTILVGPRIEYDFKVLSLFGLEATGHVMPYLRACASLGAGDCERWNVPLTGGLRLIGKADLDLALTTYNLVSTRVDAAEFSLGSFTGDIARDTSPPTFTPMNDVVVTTEPGSCTAVVNFDIPNAADGCSGVKSVTCDVASGTIFQKGTTPVTCTATDNFNNTSQTTFNVVVNDEEKPVFTSTPSNIVKFTDPGTCSAVTTFQIAATDNCPGLKLAGNFASGTAFPKGTTTVVYTATDEAGNTSTHSFDVTVIDNEAPVLSGVSATPSQINPANHKMVDVTIDHITTDNCVLPPGFAKLTVTSNEPVNGPGDGDTAPDWEVLDAHHVRLRAERAGSGSGRIYTITITVTDAAGNTTVKTVNVTVPFSQRK